MLDRFSRGDKIAAGGGLLLVISLFLPWYGIKLGDALPGGGALTSQLESITANAFDALKFIDILLLLIGAAVAVGLFLIASGKADSGLRAFVESIGGVAALLVLFRMFDQPGPGGFIVLKYGIFISFIAAVAIAVGGFLNRKDGVAT